VTGGGDADAELDGAGNSMSDAPFEAVAVLMTTISFCVGLTGQLDRDRRRLRDARAVRVVLVGADLVDLRLVEL
jgi:hypothetical protein